MAVTKKRGAYNVVIRPFQDGKQVWVRVDATTKRRALEIEAQMLAAITTGDYSELDLESRRACIRIYENRGNSLPSGLKVGQESGAFVLWDKRNPKRSGIHLFFGYPTIQAKSVSTKDRYSMCFSHFRRLWGDDKVLTEIWTPDIRKYCDLRRKEGVSSGTVGWELSTLSKFFGVLIESVQITGIRENPCLLLRGEDRKSRVRGSYLSRDFIQRILDAMAIKNNRGHISVYRVCPTWFEPMILVAYYTGMRRKELLRMERSQVNLETRIINLRKEQTKERKAKRIPVHREIIPILNDLLERPPISSDHLFTLRDRRGERPVGKEAVKSAWRRLMSAVAPTPRPTFHDLRHSFKANCANSDIPERISERILGHADDNGNLDGSLRVSHRYGAISDKELVRAIDTLAVDHGPSVINDEEIQVPDLEDTNDPSNAR